VTTIGSMVGHFLGPYRVAGLVASADDASMAEPYMVDMVVPQDTEEVDGYNN
jgi:hypothetical protein